MPHKQANSSVLRDLLSKLKGQFRSGSKGVPVQRCFKNIMSVSVVRETRQKRQEQEQKNRQQHCKSVMEKLDRVCFNRDSRIRKPISQRQLKYVLKPEKTFSFSQAYSHTPVTTKLFADNLDRSVRTNQRYQIALSKIREDRRKKKLRQQSNLPYLLNSISNRLKLSQQYHSLRLKRTSKQANSLANHPSFIAPADQRSELLQKLMSKQCKSLEQQQCYRQGIYKKLSYQQKKRIICTGKCEQRKSELSKVLQTCKAEEHDRRERRFAISKQRLEGILKRLALLRKQDQKQSFNNLLFNRRQVEMYNQFKRKGIQKKHHSIKIFNALRRNKRNNLLEGVMTLKRTAKLNGFL